MGWEKFVQCVAEAENLAQPETTDIRAELITKYPTIRCFAGAFLDVFEFRGDGAVSNLLKALALISEMYRAGKRTLPLKPPTAFIRRAWRPFVFKDGDIDRRANECVCSRNYATGFASPMYGSTGADNIRTLKLIYPEAHVRNPEG